VVYRDSVRIPAETEAILTEIFVVFLCPATQIPGWYPDKSMTASFQIFSSSFPCSLLSNATYCSLSTESAVKQPTGEIDEGSVLKKAYLF
jgi:hypothetical protein